MADFVITHRIEAPELAKAINNLADALKGRPMDSSMPQQKSNTASTEIPISTLPSTLKGPMTGAETPVATGMAEPAVSGPTTPVETPSTPSTPVEKVYSFEDITNAGSQLLEQGKMQQLMDLLKGYGVQAVTQLKPEQYADVAAGLRGLGARI